MSFEEFEGPQDGTDPRQYPDGVPLGMRILNLMANRTPQPGGTGMPTDYDPQPLNPGSQIVDMGPQLRMPSRINPPVPSSDSAAPPLGLGLQQPRRVLDGLLGNNRPQDVAQSDSA